MFRVYVQNYKFGISPELKNKINNLYSKYHVTSDPIYDYPIDLFDIKYEYELDKIFEYADTKNSSKRFVNRINQRKITEKKNMIKELQFQIDGLQAELEATSDPDKIDTINRALNGYSVTEAGVITNKKGLIAIRDEYQADIDTNLEFEPFKKEVKAISDLKDQIKILTDSKKTTSVQADLDKIDAEIKKLTDKKLVLETDLKTLRDKGKIKSDIGLYGAYLGTVDLIKKSIDSRTRTISEFYAELFQRVGRTTDLHLGIWLNYTDKQLDRTPSMIFCLLNDVLQTICTVRPTTPDLLADLVTVKEFMRVVRAYIDRRTDLPECLDENPVYNEDKDQIAFLINLIITPAIYNIILGQIDKSLEEMDATNNLYNNDPAKKDSIMEAITRTEFGTYTIKTYLEKKLPTLAFKYYTQIYQNKNDPDRKILLDTELFAPIIFIIEMNKEVTIDDESILIKNFKEYLIPFISNTYQNFIHHLRLAIFGFEKYLLNTYQLVEIYSLFMEKKNTR